ncbi:hypothetical protein IWX49DRAFT_607438 [Phyllosticta citricarpa]|uniref:Uncharacterized protein n=1 Tax=Phyllosticta citricarpa TaxID=55181 RepID=A0ABR1M6A3_9PEZI
MSWKTASLASTFLTALLGISPRSVHVSANPIQTSAPRLDQVHFEDVYNELTNATLLRRGNCANPCGWSGQLCCEAAGQCYTDSNNQAQCGAGGATSSGYWQYYTTTFVETDTITRTVTSSSWYGGGGGTAATGSASCNYNKGETACGNICCNSEQYCMLSGQCAAVGATNSPGVTATGTAASYSAPLRPTSGTLIVVTATESPTTTVPFETPVATGASGIGVSASSGGGGGGLSGGEIAGIVIGVLAGIFLLGLLILFFCAKAAFDGLLAIFGLGRKKRVRETYVQERYRHSSGSRHSGWYGDRPPPPRPVEPKRTGLGAGGILAGLGAIGAALGLSKARRNTRNDEKSTTSYGSSYYYSDYTGTSKSSDVSADKYPRCNSPVR